MSDRKLVSVEAAQRLGLTRNYLTTYVLRHPDLRPAERLPNGDFLWSDTEIAAVAERRQRRKRKK